MPGLRHFFEGLTEMPALAKMMKSRSNRPVGGVTPPYLHELKHARRRKAVPMVLQDKEHG